MKKISLPFLLPLLAFGAILSSCFGIENGDDIIILFTNDVHCAIDQSIGYSGLLSYKKKRQTETPYVALVDCGDAIQGDYFGAISKGKFIINIMNEAGYDVSILGNHEFDYGLDNLKELMEKSNFTYLCSNVKYIGTSNNPLYKLKGHEVKQYGNKKVGFVGITTPFSLTESTPRYFMDENGNFVIDFSSSSKEIFYQTIQNAVEECYKEGANYVVALGHLGHNESVSPFSSVDVIKNTKGIHAFLDGHAHATIQSRYVKNKENQLVPLSSSGTKLMNIGELIITSKGKIKTGNIDHYEEKDAKMEGFIHRIKAGFEKEMSKVIAKSNVSLSCLKDETRQVRNRETTIGNFCADAYRYISKADIAFVNGGGIRADIPKGDVTFKDIINVHPFMNSLSMCLAKGKDILDALELSVMHTLNKTKNENGDAIGEFGGFLQVSGIKFDVDLSIASSVKFDEKGLFKEVAGARRVNNVRVMKNGKEEEMDINKEYTVASSDYILCDGGNGYSMFMNKEFKIKKGMASYQCLIDYLKDELKGDLKRYENVEDRIRFHYPSIDLKTSPK